MISKFIEKKKYCNRWISDKESSKIKTINEKVFIESFIGKILVVLNYFLVMKLVHTTGNEFIPNYKTEATKYIVFLTWFVFAIMILVSIIQLITRNKVYTSDISLNAVEVDYYKYKLFAKFFRVIILTTFYIMLYQVFFQITIKSLNIKSAILWWVLILNILILIYLSLTNIKNFFKREFVKETLNSILKEVNNNNYDLAKEKIKEAREENSEIKSSDLEITINAIEEIIMISEKESFNNSKSYISKSELIANISHDLKTPLTSIINYINFLRKKNISKKERNEYIDILERKSARLKVLIKDLKESINLSNEESKIEKSEVRLDELLKESLIELEDKIKRSKLKFELDIRSNDVELKKSYIDVNKIMRVFHNLISNILKYSSENSTVIIKLEQEESLEFEKGFYTRITFRNISREILNLTGEEFMERFRRGDSSRNTEGSGLGLDIAKSLVELHKGQLKVTIENNEFIVDMVI
ncbi:HAMP domain-containing sensor histidine kinase [Clostridioides difficile]